MDRRRARRIAFPGGAPAELRVVEDIVVERVSARELTALSSVGVPRGEEVQVWLHYADGDSRHVRARSIERTPAIVEGVVRHRIRLAIVEPGELS
jgi:hypothetical protein